jgi:hypothetical protein
LLIPLTNMRQPRITRSAASLIATRVVVSNKLLLRVGVSKNFLKYNRRRNVRQFSQR